MWCHIRKYIAGFLVKIFVSGSWGGWRVQAMATRVTVFTPSVFVFFGSREIVVCIKPYSVLWETVYVLWYGVCKDVSRGIPTSRPRQPLRCEWNSRFFALVLGRWTTQRKRVRFYTLWTDPRDSMPKNRSIKCLS